MSAFFEFMKWFIKLSLVITLAGIALIAAFVLGRRRKA